MQDLLPPQFSLPLGSASRRDMRAYPTVYRKQKQEAGSWAPITEAEIPKIHWVIPQQITTLSWKLRVFARGELSLKIKLAFRACVPSDIIYKLFGSCKLGTSVTNFRDSPPTSAQILPAFRSTSSYIRTTGTDTSVRTSVRYTYVFSPLHANDILMNTD